MDREQRRSALVVDDAEANRYLLARVLAAAGYDVREAATGAEALAGAADQPDVIVLDVKLPDVDGFEVARRLKNDPTTALIPIIQITAELPPTAAYKVHGLDSGADAYLPGPVEPRELVATANALLRARRAAADARRAARFLDLVIAQAPTLIVAVDDDGRVALFNPECERVTGYSAAEVLGRSMLPMLVPASCRDEVAARFASSDAAELATPHTNPWLTKTGEERAIEWRCFTVDEPSRMVVGVGIDVTERRRAEAERARLLAEAETARRLIDSSLIGVVSAGLDRITDANDEFLRIVGYTREDLAADRLVWRAMTPPEWAAADDRAIAELLERGECTPFEKEYVRKDGTRVPILLGAVLLSTQPLHCVCFVLDISARKRAEGEREAARQDAEEANRAKDRFLAALSHELRTPLSTMVGLVTMLRRGTVPDDQLGRMLEMLERNTRLQARLVDDLLDLSRIVRGKTELRMLPVDLGVIATDTVESSRPVAEAKGVALGCSVPGAPITVLGDPARLQQVVGNVLSNAIKFTPAGGRVDVHVARVEDRARMTVRDTGEGIEPDLLPHVFEAFRQGGATGTGLGLGLAIARSLLEAHRGTIHAESGGRGQGTTFVIELPLSGPSTASEPSPGSAPLGVS